jgi:hypothetical protein
MKTSDLSYILWTIDPMNISYVSENEYDLEAKVLSERLDANANVLSVVIEVFNELFYDGCISLDKSTQIAESILEMKYKEN